MFPETVTTIFGFLQIEFGFQSKVLNDRTVQFERGDAFIRVSHTTFDEVTLSVGCLIRGNQNKSFDSGVLIALDSPTTAAAYRKHIASKPEHIEQALRELRQLLVLHGKRFLDGDPTVLGDMQRFVDDYWANRNAAQIRARAEAAFTVKDYATALKQYRLLGDGKKPLDFKRMEMCERLK